MSTSSVTGSDAQERSKQTERDGSVALGKLFSIELRLHISVLIIGTLIVASLARGVLPEWHAEWSTMAIWSAALIAGLLFFASLIAHELAHALVARHYGIQTGHITLFLFGAMAAIEREPSTPKEELLIASAGPAMSLALACLFGGMALVSDFSLFAATADQANGNQVAPTFSDLSYLGTVFLWLASINAMLGIFNLIPGFPMDGGRILRAVLWWRSADLAKSTQIAARGGVMFGWVLILYGALLVFNGHVANGLWSAAIGYFISHLARASAEQFLRNQVLHATTVADLMRTRFERVPGSLPLDEFLDDYLLRSSQRIWPVTMDGEDVGYISLEDIPAVSERTSKGYRWVADCMHSLDSGDGLSPQMQGVQALRRLAEERLPLPVIDGKETPNIIGLIHQNDVLRWISQHADLAQTPQRQ